MISQHKENKRTILEKLQATDIENSNTFDTNASDNKRYDESDDPEGEFVSTISQSQEHFSKYDKMFKELYDNIAGKVEESVDHKSVATMIEILHTIKLGVTDRVGGTLLLCV